MQNPNEYQKFVADLEQLKARALYVGMLCNQYYPKKYPLYSDINDYTFFEDDISVKSGQSFRGSYDEEWLNFPSSWLFKADEEIRIALLAQIESDLIIETNKANSDAMIKTLVKEQEERKQYEILKEKFEK